MGKIEMMMKISCSVILLMGPSVISQFGPPRGQLLLRLLLKLVSESNCLENRSRILVILPNIPTSF